LINIFDYFDYRQYLRELFDEKKRACAAFSHRALAQKLGLSTSNFILLVMQGKRNLNTDLRGKIAAFFGLGEKEAGYFETMISFAQAKTDSEKNRHLSRMISIRKSLQIYTLHDSQLEYLGKWYNPVLRELVTSLDWRGDFDLLARSVRPAITAAQAKRAVELLIECGLITLKDGEYVQTSSLITTNKTAISPVITNFHREMGQKALEALDAKDRENRNITGCTVHISKKTFERIKEELTQCRSRVLAPAQEDNNSDIVYQLNLQLFPVSAPARKRRKA
jgi:uncharacterized protein (TIGR02147 family)